MTVLGKLEGIQNDYRDLGVAARDPGDVLTPIRGCWKCKKGKGNGTACQQMFEQQGVVLYHGTLFEGQHLPGKDTIQPTKWSKYIFTRRMVSLVRRIYICIYKNAIKIFIQRHKYLFKFTHIAEKEEEYFLQYGGLNAKLKTKKNKVQSY